MLLAKGINSIILWVLLIPSSTFSTKIVFEFDRRLSHSSRDLLPNFDGKKEELPPDQYFEQKLDHFNLSNGETWQQRYWANWRYYTATGPAILWIEGENWAYPNGIIDGQWVSYAEIFKGVIFSLEHRFYGRSVPKNDTSTENLVYLSSQQALADIAFFIQGITKQYYLSDDIKWIVFGCSYAGNLAAWVRMKYPSLVHGAVASSAPILAKADFGEYYQVVKASLDSYHPNCSSRIAEATQQLDRLIKTEAGRKHITKLFQLCTELQDSLSDIASFFQKLATQVANVVQYNKAYRKSNNEIPPRRSIEHLCDIMTYSDASALDLYAAFHIVNLVQGRYTCRYHTDEKYIEKLRKTDINTILGGSGNRQWTYQTCTEFGYYQRSSTTSDTFGIPLLSEQDVKLCEKVFGPEFNETRLKNGIYRTNTIYGGLQVNVGNIIFVHGSVDPWHPLGITRVESKNSPYKVVFINGTSHCGDLNYYDKDIDEVKEARKKIQKIMQSWLQNK
ncbi:putative serine protease K12H4.7 [Planococcus citri]|uniref:putative serine protease K12H4.7 n=1 Tax=Planococcus citri TaxID=170843 RepID=UPI0031F82B30